MEIRLCAFADETSAAIDHQIEALKRNSIPYLEIRNVDGCNIAKITLEKAKEQSEKEIEKAKKDAQARQNARKKAVETEVNAWKNLLNNK